MKIKVTSIECNSLPNVLSLGVGWSKLDSVHSPRNSIEIFSPCKLHSELPRDQSHNQAPSTSMFLNVGARLVTGVTREATAADKELKLF